MNMAFYIDSFNNQAKLEGINAEVERNKKANTSIFYNKIGPSDINFKCAMFPSADMWAFEGYLVIDTISNLNRVNNIVNKFKKIFYYTFGSCQAFDLLTKLNGVDKVICDGENSANEFTRITNLNPDAIIDNYEGITSVKL